MIAFALANWRYLAVAGLLIGFGLWLRSYGHHQCERCRAEVVAVYQVDLAKANERVRQAEERADAISRARDTEWQGTVIALRDRVSDLQSRREPVRLCKPTGRIESAEISPATGEPDATAGAGGHDLQASRDLGDDLVRYAGECERYRKQVGALQEWITVQASAR